MAEFRSFPSNKKYRKNYERLFGKEILTVEKESIHAYPWESNKKLMDHLFPSRTEQSPLYERFKRGR